MFFRRKNWLAYHAKDQNLIKRPRSRWHFIWPWLLAVLVIFLIGAVPLSLTGWKIYSRLTIINSQVGNLAESAKVGNFSDLKNGLVSISGDLLYIQKTAKRAGPVLWIPAVAKTANTADQMISASIDLLDGYGQLIEVLSSMEISASETNIISSLATPEGKKYLLQTIYNNRSKLVQAKAKIQSAKNRLQAINNQDLNGIFGDRVLVANNLLLDLTEQSDIAFPFFQYLPELLGYNLDKNYLLLFQNNMELRPTGGFIGSYGLISVRDGEVKNIQTDDIYNLDKHSIGKLEVPTPEPMSKYINQKYLFLRDANWSPDWPTSAKTIDWFWEAERVNAKLPPVKLDGIIAITPDFIANILKMTGPITVDGITFHKNNFAIELEKAVEFSYAERGLAPEQRKDIIGDLSQELLNRFFKFGPQELMQLWAVMKTNIDEKQIIVWLREDELQDFVLAENWAGEVRSSVGDYLYVVDANLAALKTDQVMQREINYSLKASSQGELNAKAEITYIHQGKKITGMITKYRTYTRVYLPVDTWINKVYVKDNNGVQNYAIGKDVDIGSELGRTYVGLFLTVDPGKSRTLILEYRLPESVKKNYLEGVYNFLVQKQPGTAGHKLKIDLSFDQVIASYNAVLAPIVEKSKNLIFDTDLRKDREFGIKF